MSAAAMLNRATWPDPARVADSAGALRAGRKVILYGACGVDASFFDGGFDAWQREGRDETHRWPPGA